jgi:sugar/nucleoside kinase (ribokinase family)
MENKGTVPDIVCVGRIIREMIYFPSETIGPLLGSPAAYCSVAAASQGTPTGIVTRIGKDMPWELLQRIVEAGVDTTGILDDDQTTQTVLIYDSKGNKEIRYPVMSKSITGRDIPDSYAGCSVLYLSPMDQDVLLEDLDGVVNMGKTSAIDLGGYGGVHMSLENRLKIHSLEKFALEAAAHFDIVKASDEDARSIFGWNNPDTAARRLLDCGPAVVLITLGARGCLLQTPEKQWLIEPVQGIKVIDATGGGDTFMAGFLCEYRRSEDPYLAAQMGNTTASFVIQNTGGVHVRRMPVLDEVNRRFSQNYLLARDV